MFILDTNVLSNAMAGHPEPAVAAWIARQPPELLFTASICQAEILSGIAILPQGRRRASLETAANAMFRDDFAGRVLPFDGEAAIAYADCLFGAGAGRAAGGDGRSDDCGDRPHQRRECRHAHIGDFEDCGLTLIDPWSAP
jgi:predicted nucleic acid-binding protein